MLADGYESAQRKLSELKIKFSKSQDKKEGTKLKKQIEELKKALDSPDGE